MRVRIQQFISNFKGNTSAPVFPTHGEKNNGIARQSGNLYAPSHGDRKTCRKTKFKIHNKCMSRFICPLWNELMNFSLNFKIIRKPKLKKRKLVLVVIEGIITVCFEVKLAIMIIFLITQVKISYERYINWSHSDHVGCNEWRNSWGWQTGQKCIATLFGGGREKERGTFHVTYKKVLYAPL